MKRAPVTPQPLSFMKTKVPFLLLLFLGFGLFGYAQNPFQDIGVEVKPITLSKGKYDEFHDGDSVVRIGNALFNVHTERIVGFVEEDTFFDEATLQPEVTSRWLSIDPLAKEFPSWSPYVFANDNPIFFNDPTGASGEATIDKESKTITVTSIFAFYGGSSTPELARQYAKSIQDSYNNANGRVMVDGVRYRVKFDIKGIAASEVAGDNGDLAAKVAMADNTDIRKNFVRLENWTNTQTGASYSDDPELLGCNTGYWSVCQNEESGGTTTSHEYNHSLGGLNHPEKVNPNGVDLDAKPSIDMTILSYNFANPLYRTENEEGRIILDVSNRSVQQKNIDALFKSEVVNQLKNEGKADIGRLTNKYHPK
jgi:hypothetical protein